MRLANEANWARRSALAGGLVWLLLLIVSLGDSPQTGLIQRLLLFGVLVVVPLALSLVPPTRSHILEANLYKLSVLMQPFGAVAAIASFVLQPGNAAAGLAFVWLVVTACIALRGLERLRHAELRCASEVSITAAFLFLPVGGVWMLASRVGMQLFGFGDTMVLLTAVHFHFAAYAAPIIAGLSGRFIGESSTFRLVPALIIIGTPLVAAGITVSPVLALIGALAISSALIVLATLVLRWIVPRIRNLLARLLLLISSLSSVAAMILACLYAYSIIAKRVILDIPHMAMTHGVINAFGFVLCGLTAWTIIESSRISNLDA